MAKSNKTGFGAVSARILANYHPDLTVREVALRADVDYELARRVLLYHKKRCLTTWQRILLLRKQLEDKIGIRIIY